MFFLFRFRFHLSQLHEWYPSLVQRDGDRRSDACRELTLELHTAPQDESRLTVSRDSIRPCYFWSGSTSWMGAPECFTSA